MADTRKIKARYHVTALGMQEVTENVYTMKDGKCEPEVRISMQQCFLAQFPQGHSIRVVGVEALRKLELDRKPRMVDMETGETVDYGGDVYDFANEVSVELLTSKSRTTSSNATA